VTVSRVDLMKRAVSLVPSATDVIVALGAAASLVGISADCDQPEPGRPLPVVTRPLIDSATARWDAAAVDALVQESVATGQPLYSLDVEQVVALAPDVVFAQDACSVCALPSSEVTGALADIGVNCEVVSIDAVELDEVLGSFSAIGGALGLPGAGAALETSCRERLRDLSERSSDRQRPRVAVLDWADPVYLAGNWVPDLVRAAGGEPVLAAGAEPSRQVTLEAVAGAEPELVVLAPCGLDLETAMQAGRAFRRRYTATAGTKAPPIVAFDGRVWFSRPGPQLVEGAEALAAWLSGAPPAETVRTAAVTQEDHEGR
jgi:iron complex transport system substrate-binding protein